MIPEAHDLNISLARVVAVVDDLSGSRLEMMEELSPVKLELGAVCGVLATEGKF